MSKYPKFMIIGAARSGTSSLHRNLELHPELKGPKLGRVGVLGYDKETHFFDNYEKYIKGLPWYLSLWPNTQKNLMKFESTPNYLFISQVPKRIKQTLPNWKRLKFIIMLRDPVRRAWSHLWHWRNSYNGGFALNPTADWVLKGIYINQIKNWHRHFDKSQFLIIKSEDYFKNPQAVLIEVHKFLEVPVIYIVDTVYFDPKKQNQKRMTRYPRIPENLQKSLVNFYAPYNMQLFEYLKREFEDWL